MKVTWSIPIFAIKNQLYQIMKETWNVGDATLDEIKTKLQEIVIIPWKVHANDFHSRVAMHKKNEWTSKGREWVSFSMHSNEWKSKITIPLN